jgi:hypothetical protein
MRRIYLDAGKSDEWYLDLGAQAFAAELDKLGVDHTLELFEGKHGGIAYRYPGAIPRARRGPDARFLTNLLQVDVEDQRRVRRDVPAGSPARRRRGPRE